MRDILILESETGGNAESLADALRQLGYTPAIRHVTAAERTEDDPHAVAQSTSIESRASAPCGSGSEAFVEDFGNLLTVILGYADMALDTIQTEDPAFAAVSEIRSAAGRAAALATDMSGRLRTCPHHPLRLDRPPRREPASP